MMARPLWCHQCSTWEADMRPFYLEIDTVRSFPGATTLPCDVNGLPHCDVMDETCHALLTSLLSYTCHSVFISLPLLHPIHTDVSLESSIRQVVDDGSGDGCAPDITWILIIIRLLKWRDRETVGRSSCVPCLVLSVRVEEFNAARRNFMIVCAEGFLLKCADRLSGWVKIEQKL